HDLDLDRVVDLPQAAAALQREGGAQVGRCQDPAVRALEPDPAGDRRGEPQVVEVDADVVDRVDALRPGRVGQQPGDVPGECVVAGAVRGQRREDVGSGASSSQASASPVAAGAGPAPSSDARRSSSSAIPFLILPSVFSTSPSRPTSTLTAYSSAPPRISSASRCAAAMISWLCASAACVRP